MDIVYVTRPGGNYELRYSLRSLSNLPHDQVWIVGYTPSFVTGVRSVMTVQDRDRWTNGHHNWTVACQQPEISDPFVCFDDDFFVVEPITEIPVLHRGPLEERAIERPDPGGYAPAMLRTAELLKARGVDEPLSYELHVPLVVSKAGWSEALDLCKHDTRMMPRSIYANLAGLGGTRTEDVKVHGADIHIPPGPFISTADNNFGSGPVGRHIRGLFPEPCAYERDHKGARR